MHRRYRPFLPRSAARQRRGRSTRPEGQRYIRARTAVAAPAEKTAPADKAVPVTLTYWDLGFLKSLYSTDNSYLASYQRGDMEQVLSKTVETSDQEPKK